jgi:flavin-dependent dehydrogenase
MPTPYLDALVLGGGPAGCAAAIGLIGSGLRAAVLERSAYDVARVGETLPPDAATLLNRLGVWAAFVRDGHLPSPGIVSVWGDQEPYENDFLFNPYGDGWHLDRRRFDAMLATAAEERGAVVLRNTRVLACSKDAFGGWRVDIQSNGKQSSLQAMFLVDATGRASWLGWRLGARRLVGDYLVGVVGTFHHPGLTGAERDPRMLLEAAEHGWWYSVPLPNDCLSIAYMTDVDLLPKPPRDLEGFWRARLSETALTRQRLAGAALPNALRTVSASSYRMDRVAGENWLAVGDAAMAWDPLSSQGISKALASALSASEFIGEVRAGRRSTLAGYETALAESFDQYRRLRGHYYGQVRRWPNSPFWKRRASTVYVDRALNRGTPEELPLSR